MFRSTTARHAAVAMFAAFLMVACGGAAQEGTDLASPNQQAIKEADGSGAYCVTLYAGQTIEAGTVCVSSVCADQEFVVTYNTTGGWELEEAHLWLGDDFADMPQTRKGNPKIGNFPYATGDITGETTHTFTVPYPNGLDCADLDCEVGKILYMAAHAALRKANGDGTYQTETGWADGPDLVDRGSWATYTPFTLIPDDCDGTEPPADPDCETAFAYDVNGTCFLDIDEDGDNKGDFNRWGWTIPLSEGGSATYKIYAGAGQCDLEKGTHVGDLTVEYTNGTVTATYSMTSGSAYSMDELHFYAGNEILPRDVNDEYTVAPGQYPVVVGDLDASTNETVTISGLSGDVYVVAHAVVCGFEQE